MARRRPKPVSVANCPVARTFRRGGFQTLPRGYPHLTSHVAPYTMHVETFTTLFVGNASGGFETLPYEARSALRRRLCDQMPSAQLAVLSVEA